MKITAMKFYDGAREKVCRLGLTDLFLEVQEILFGTTVLIKEEKDANGAAAIRKLIDEAFLARKDWKKTTAGGVDWIKKLRYNKTLMVSMGVEIQVSARSDLLIRDIIHLRNEIDKGSIEVGLVVVPSDLLETFLPDRCPSFSEATKYIEVEFKEAMNYPLVLIAIEHDGIGEALPKQKRKS